MPEGSTKECCGLMIMSGVGTTYMMGGCLGYASGSQIDTGMLYFTPCNPSCNFQESAQCHAFPKLSSEALTAHGAKEEQDRLDST